jgi:acetyl esterase
MASLDYFAFDPDWKGYASRNGLPVPTNDIPTTKSFEPAKIDFTAARPYQALADMSWAKEHSLESVGYQSHITAVETHDSALISVKISYPNASRRSASEQKAFPVLFVTHGGGWVSGSHVSEEAWTLWPLYMHFNLVIVSVEYRLAPENQFPTWIDDCWDVLKKFMADPESFLSGTTIRCDPQKLILVGSSSGAAISATLSQVCRDEGLPILGVILNVPVLCDYRHFEPETSEDNSYTQCADTFLGSRQMAALWNMILPSAISGDDPKASPLLGNLNNLAPHLLFVAGRDPLREEGIMYARKLESAGVSVQLSVYKGVPHNFAHYDQLESTLRFRHDLKAGLATLLSWKSK